MVSFLGPLSIGKIGTAGKWSLFLGFLYSGHKVRLHCTLLVSPTVGCCIVIIPELKTWTPINSAFFLLEGMKYTLWLKSWALKLVI